MNHANPQKTPPKLHILLLTEDSGANGFDTVKEIVRHSLLHCNPSTQTHLITYTPANDSAKQALRANNWKNKTHRNTVDLLREMATHVAKDVGPIIFHYDGDTAWDQRSESANTQKFQEIILSRLCLFLQSMPNKHGSKYSSEDAEELVKNVIQMVPFYSIEAWLFHNQEQLKSIYREIYTGQNTEQDQKTLQHWQDKPTILGNTDQPKEQLSIRDEYNLQLAKHNFPADLLYGLNQSYTVFVTDLSEQPHVSHFCGCFDF